METTDLDIKLCEKKKKNNELLQNEDWGCQKRGIRTWTNLEFLIPFSLLYVLPS